MDATEQKVVERLNVYMDSETRARIKRVVSVRGGADSQNAVWLLQHALDWWEGLSRDEKMTV